MTRRTSFGILVAAVVAATAGAFVHAQQSKWARDPQQPVNEQYTKKIKEYTTAPSFGSPLVDYLPASKTVPAPDTVIGDIAGAPGKLPYAEQVYAYMRALEKATPCVKVFSIGRTEEGREMIAVAVADASLLARLDENRARLAKLADPRSIKLDDAEADRLVAASTPVYYITGTIHSPETGAPTALMELAYRLAVDDAPYIKAIRSNVITMITPVVEVDGRDRQVDIYNWHLAHPKENVPPLVYWGHYLVHDNNRDAMGATLDLTKNVINFFVDQKAQLLHDLHESVPFLYDNTVGDGPYNAWVDPILTDEWQLIGWNNMSEMTKLGMPGAFTHGQFDTWSPGYLMFIAAMHNGTSRLYETFGNGGADTVERTLRPSEYARTWYRQNPPLPKVLWSQRDNNNYIETGLLTSLSYYATNNKLFLKNFYLKAKRSVLKATTEGPAAYVLPADDAHPGLQARLLRVLQTQRCEISRATAPFTVTLPVLKRPGRAGDEAPAGAKPAAEKTETRQFPAGSYVVRMDQPYSRIADALLDYQYWSPSDPQKNPYDDTGWTFGELFDTQVVRVMDRKVLDAPMELVQGAVTAPSAVHGAGAVYLVNNDTDPHLFALRYRLKDRAFDAAEEPFEAAGRAFARGSFIIKAAPADEVRTAAGELGLQVYAVAAAPSVRTHAVTVPRIGYVHTWLGTQDEGWWRQELDQLKVPYDYISTQVLAKTPDLRAKYDVLVFPPVGRPAAQVVSGLPMWGNPLPWKTTALTPNIGKLDSTDDMRPGLGFAGLANLDAFVRAGGLLVTTDDTSELAVDYGLTQGVSVQRSPRAKIPGSVVRSKFVDLASPVAYGYGENLSVYLSGGMAFAVSNTLGGRGGRFGGDGDRPTGRGTLNDPDVPQGRPYEAPPAEPKVEPWQAAPVTAEQLRNPITVIPVKQRPRVILRFVDAKDLLVSGLVEGAGDIADRPAVVDVPHDKGHVLVFSPNPVWRGETQGSYAMVFNAILHFDHLDAGRKWDEK